MELLCNNCGAIVNAQDVNIATDLAKCSTCNTLMRASELKEYVDTADLLLLPANA
jgi:DNA-directed RNA polymerase subunit M/transcription elongation factor TFIIS